ncbi:MAG: hypothetical protein VYA51_12655 [Planctomycetota bacterium]|nr:hypothetical protein [Planctomycetota bacterium]MEC9048853.1 hypothetical protein [Planctomycetota bacterium]
MSPSKNQGSPAGRGQRSALADRRLLLPLSIVLLVVGFYGLQWWRAGARRAEQRRDLISDTRAALAESPADRDRLGELMTGLTMLEDAATSSELLALQAEIELLRGRPDGAYRLFGAIAERPGASAAEQRLGARIQLARQDGFGGDAPASAAMLQQVVSFSEAAFADSGAAADAFRAWQACKRLWKHERAAGFAAELAAAHPESREQRLVALSQSFDPTRDAVAVEDLVIDFGDDAPAELSALETFVALQRGRIPEAKERAERDLNRFAGVAGVRYVLAIVLHACALGNPEGSIDRATFVQRRDQQLDWLEQRAPETESLRRQWQQMRSVR